MSDTKKKRDAGPQMRASPVLLTGVVYKDALAYAKFAVRQIEEFSRRDRVTGTSEEERALRRVTDACRLLTESAIDELTHEERDDLVKAIKPILDDLVKVDEFARETGNPTLMIAGIQKQCDVASPIVSDYAERAAVRMRFKQAESAIAKNKGEVEKVKETQAQISAAKQADFFGKEADRHESEAKVWREWVGISVAAFAVVAILSWWWSDDVDTGFALAQSLAGRALVFIVLGFGVFFCAKNYMAHRHNAVVNRHRQKALETYRALAEADPQSRSIVLAHAARCIYAPQDSGFARKGESESGKIPIEEILRMADKKGDK